MKHLLLSVFFLLALISCKKEEIDKKISNCLSEEKEDGLTGCIKENFGSLYDDYCEVIIVENVIRLSEGAKMWLPFYCYEVGEKIYYSNEQGNETFLSVKRKSYGRISTGHEEVGTCRDSTDRNKIYCVDGEYANITLSSDLLGLEPIISIKGEIKQPFSIDSIKTGTSLEIYTIRRTDSSAIITPHFNLTIENEDLMIESNIKYYPEIEILGKYFFYVYSQKFDFFSVRIKIYYNKEFGLVSFVDKTGVQWRLDE
ncbi:MAG: hypothetical protein AB8B69_05330 [Chitinophagales bacterium]